jgi:lactoylglutathione lyase
MPKYAYDHVHLMSPDPVKTAQFYVKMFGAKISRTMSLPDGGKAVFLTIPGSNVIISPQKGAPANGLEHWGMTTDDIEKTVTELKAAGCKFQMEITQVGPGLKIAFFYAPDNVLIELLESKG